MDRKKQVLLEMLGELHEICVKNGIIYFLSEDCKRPYSITIKMDSSNLLRFIDRYNEQNDQRTLEWMGNNYRFVGSYLRYINKDTFYYTEDRLMGEINLGMFVTIDTIKASRSKWKKAERYWKYLRYSNSTKRSYVLNRISKNIHRDMILKSEGKLKKRDIEEVEIQGIRFYARKGSSFTENPDDCFDKMIKVKANSDTFICDEALSFRDVDLTTERNKLKKINKGMNHARLSYKKGDTIRVRDVDISRASFLRFHLVTELLGKYSYDDILEHANDEPIRSVLSKYIQDAKKYRGKGCSLYIGEEFTKIINRIFPEVDTEDLYKFTPELYRKGIKMFDYNGNSLETYGGENEQ